MALLKPRTLSRTYICRNWQKGFQWMNGTFKMQDEKMMWYENYKPVQEYLDSEFPEKSTVVEIEQKTARLSWLEIMKKSAHIK